MGQLNTKMISPVVEDQILSFLNRAFTPKDIVQFPYPGTDPRKGDYGIGPTVAKRIIDRRWELPSRRYTELSQLEDIKGFGQDKLDDLVESFNLPSAERFKMRLFQQRILFENFDLQYQIIRLPGDHSLQQVIKDPVLLREQVLEAVAAFLEGENEDARQQLEQAYVDPYLSANVASYAMALWFYKFDEDNWFTFDRIRTEIAHYLDLSFEYAPGPVLLMVKGFDQALVMRSGITVLDIPVVVNASENAIYCWFAQLFD